MVTVPALGPEWGRSEMRDMTKAGRREKKTESRREKFKAWNRGERGICGPYFTRRVLVFTVFGLLSMWVMFTVTICELLLTIPQYRDYSRIHRTSGALFYAH